MISAGDKKRFQGLLPYFLGAVIYLGMVKSYLSINGNTVVVVEQPRPQPDHGDIYLYLRNKERKEEVPNNPAFIHDDVQEIFDKYLSARSRGMSQDDVAIEVFKTNLPSAQETRPHSYPFLSGDTLRAYADYFYDSELSIKIAFDSVVSPQLIADFEDGDLIFVKSDFVDLVIVVHNPN